MHERCRRQPFMSTLFSSSSVLLEFNASNRLFVWYVCFVLLAHLSPVTVVILY